MSFMLSATILISILSVASILRADTVQQSSVYKIVVNIYSTIDHYLKDYVGISLRQLLIAYVFLRISWTVGFVLGAELAVIVSASLYSARKKGLNQQVLRQEVWDQLTEAEGAKALLQKAGVPAWTNYAGVERTKWFDALMEGLWPYLAAATEDTLRAVFNRQLSYYSRPPFGSLELTRCRLGTAPLRINGVEEHHTDDDSTIDFYISWNSDADIRVKASFAQLEFAVENFSILPSVLRVQLAGHINRWPLFKAFRISFREKPELSMSLKAMVQFDGIPGLTQAVSDMIEKVFSFMTFPESYVYAMVPEELTLVDRYSAPIGEVSITIHSLSSGEDKAFFSNDYYVDMMVSGAVIGSSKDKDGEETHRSLIYDPRTQIELRAFAKQGLFGGKSKLLGAKVVYLSDVMQQPIDHETDAISCDSHLLRLTYSVAFATLSSDEAEDAKPTERADDASTPQKTSTDEAATERAAAVPFPESSVLLIIRVDRCANLQNVEMFGKSDPYVQLSCGNARTRTATQKSTQDPTYNEKLQLNLENVSVQRDVLTISVLDEERVGSSREMGQLRIPLSRIRASNNILKLSGETLQPQGQIWMELRLLRHSKSKS